MPRLFSALPIAEAQTDDLVALIGELDGANWIDADDYHITLAFFGDVDNLLADEIVSELDRIDCPPVPVEITGLGSFTRKGLPYSVFADVRLSEELSTLHTRHQRILRRHGFTRNHHDFRPHITLARLNGRVPAVDCAEWLSARASFRCATFVSYNFALYSAQDSIGGGPYVREEDFRLRAR